MGPDPIRAPAQLDEEDPVTEPTHVRLRKFNTRETYPEQNLDRCRTQFKLVSEMEAHFDEMNEIVERVVRGE